MKTGTAASGIPERRLPPQGGAFPGPRPPKTDPGTTRRPSPEFPPHPPGPLPRTGAETRVACAHVTPCRVPGRPHPLPCNGPPCKGMTHLRK